MYETRQTLTHGICTVKIEAKAGRNSLTVSSNTGIATLLFQLTNEN
jgi:hypothetical protein